jgi:hypothetical protein
MIIFNHIHGWNVPHIILFKVIDIKKRVDRLEGFQGINALLKSTEPVPMHTQVYNGLLFEIRLILFIQCGLKIRIPCKENVHGVNQKGTYGTLQIILATDPDGKIIGNFRQFIADAVSGAGS